MHFSSRTMVLAALRFAAVTVLLVAGTRVIPGCSNTPSDVTSIIKTPGNPNPSGSCSHPAPGCGCSLAGATAPCGNVEIKSGDSVVCSDGTTTCVNGTWGECKGDITVSPSSISGGRFRLQVLTASVQCGEGGVPANPCDPYCNGFPSGDSGPLEIPPGPGACQCDEPVDPTTLAAGITVSGLPMPCTGANDAGFGTDNCNEDYQCLNGTCKPYPAAGVNPACTAAPDYTLGLGCNNGSSWDLTVCNRGYVPTPPGGMLWIGIGDGTPGGGPGACPWPTTAIAAPPANENGECQVNLATNKILPGQCINVNVATQCTQLDGVTPLTLNSQHHWAMVNPPASVLAGTTPLPECDTCNNYTGLEKHEIGPSSECVNTTCGSNCGDGGAFSGDAGVEGGSGCHTYVTGTVYDPGANIPLPGIDVYQIDMLSSLPVFVDGPHCDTCTSVLPPTANIVASTASAIDGTFALEVGALTNVPVVFQTGRWRRAVTLAGPLTACAQNNITVPADCTYPGVNCKSRLPQTHAEGDIPLTAVVTGSLEPFECSIAQFMGGSGEFGIGGANRIQVFQDTGANQLNGAGLPASTALWPALAPATTAYNQVIFGCGGNGSDVANIGNTNPPAQTNLYGFMQAGGKAFLNHRSMRSVGLPPASGGFALPAWSATSTWGQNENNANNLTGRVAPGASVAVTSGTGATITAPATITGLTGMLPAYVGDTIVFTGAASGANNVAAGFTILTVASATSVTISAGAVTDANNGAINWSITSPNGTPGQAQFKSWLQAQGAYSAGPPCGGGVGVCTPQPVMGESITPDPVLGFEWLRGAVTNPAAAVGQGNSDQWGAFPTGDYSLIYSFDSNAGGPVATLSPDGGPGGGCGRTVMSAMHVNTFRGASSGNIPMECNLGGGETPNEQAFEYLFFELSACNLGGAPIQNSAPPPPPMPPALMPTTVNLTFQASCPAGTGPVWSYFEWQATIPPGTNISFSAETAPAADGGGPGTYGPSVPIGTAGVTTPPGWTTDPCPVQGHLQDLAVYGPPLTDMACTGSTPASAQTSQEYLQVSITFTPAGLLSPVLTQWEQLYDCVPNQ